MAPSRSVTISLFRFTCGKLLLLYVLPRLLQLVLGVVQLVLESCHLGAGLGHCGAHLPLRLRLGLPDRLFAPALSVGDPARAVRA